MADACILLIEDERIIANVVQTFLEANGFRVVLAMNGEEGLNYFRAHREQTDVVLLDGRLPDLSGAEVLAQILGLQPSQPIVLTTAGEDPRPGIASIDRNRVRFLQKPYDLQVLDRTIRDVLSGRPASPFGPEP